MVPKERRSRLWPEKSAVQLEEGASRQPKRSNAGRNRGEAGNNDGQRSARSKVIQMS